MSTTVAEINAERLEQAVFIGWGVGLGFLLFHAVFGGAARRAGGRTSRVFVELQRKSFHILGGTILASSYHWGIKWGFLSSGCLYEIPRTQPAGQRPLDGAVACLGLCFVMWVLDALRLQAPSASAWSSRAFRGLLRERELTRAAGTAFFLPGTLAAIMAGPEDTAILGVLFLSLGDAASSLGTAAGVVPVGRSARKVEGSVACCAVCAALSLFVGLDAWTALVTAVLVTLAEVLDEVIGVDDNVTLPMIGVLGVRMVRGPQFAQLAGVMGVGLACAIALGLTVAWTTAHATPNACNIASGEPPRKKKN
eukprot:m51a1_g13716 hypothetical protein (309) ;mRNA; f:98268-99194